MSRLQELVERYCPDGVEYKALGELGAFYGGLTGKSKNDFGEGAKFVTYNNVYSNPAINLEEYGLVQVNPGEKQNTVEFGDVVFTISSENREEAGLTSVMTVDPGEPWYLNSFCTGWRLNDKSLLLPDFLKHVLRGPEVRGAISRTANGVTRFNISKPRLAKVRIPVPPIEVQREVVRILDEYTAAHDELVSQLDVEKSLRKQQFSIIFDELVRGVDMEAVALDKLAQMTYGYTAKAVEDGDIRIIRITDIDPDGYLLSDSPRYIVATEESSLKELTYGDIVVARTGGSYGKTLFYREDRSSVYASFLIKLDFDEDLIDSEYYWYFSRSEIYWNQANSLVSTGGQPQFNANALKRVLVPLPALDDQKRIVEAMRVVESSIKGLSETLDHEIECCNRQLSLIRNQLLSFPEKVA